MKPKQQSYGKPAKPSTIEEVDLEAPARRRGVLIEEGERHLATPTTIRCRALAPEGIFPAILGHEGAGAIVDTGRASAR